MKLTVRRVRLDAQGYDSKGKYWGTGLPLYYCPELADARSPLFYGDAYVRARNSGEARRIFKKLMGGVTFSGLMPGCKER